MSTRWGKQKPPLGAQINWAHPLANGLVLAFVASRSGSIVPILGGNSVYAPLTGSPSFSEDGLLSTTTDGGAYNANISQLIPSLPKSAFSVYWYGRHLGAETSAPSILFGVLHNASNSSPYVGCAIGGPTTSKYTLYTNDSGTTLKQVNSSTNWLSAYEAKNRTLVGTCISGRQNIYLNGKLDATGTQTYTTIGYSVPTINIGMYGPGRSRTSNTLAAAGALWSVELTADQVAWLNAEPYAFIQPPQPYRKYFVAPTASAITGSASITQAGNTVSAAGTVEVAGSASITQSGNTLSAAGTVDIAASAAIGQADGTVSAAGAVAIAGESSQAQAGNTVAAAGAVAITGAASITQDGNTVSAEASSGTIGEAAITQAGNTVLAAGSVAIAGAASLTQTGTISAAGTVLISGVATLTQSPNTLSANGFSGDQLREIIVGTVMNLNSTRSIASLNPIRSVRPIVPE